MKALGRELGTSISQEQADRLQKAHADGRSSPATRSPSRNPDLFLAAAGRLGADPRDCFVIGDSVWDMLAARRAGALGIGLLSGGYGKEELQEAGPYRVYDHPAHLLAHLDELGIRGAG